MIFFEAREMRRWVGLRLPDDSADFPKRPGRPAFPAIVLVALTISAWLGTQSLAADRLQIERGVPAPVVPGSAKSAGQAVSPPALTKSTLAPSNVSSLSEPGQRVGRCAMLRKRYAQSEACFARYRMKNRGLQPGAFKRCKQLKDPSVKCG